ncbi:acyltransferase [Flavobacterium bomense]|uniref:Acyltransferase n=1 Tax=Flavobacterium bomense TaxID=2497483 RepID=A0A432CGG5_9FLAO|nr:acyltransferase [Flavobacterium bomense]RTZ02053.1 acyltransferase [Flavobacterium bomense]
MINSVKKIIRLTLSLPKTIYFNFYVFPFKVAIKLPALIDYKTKFYELHKNTVLLNGKVKFAMVKIGWGKGSIGNECNRYNYWGIKKDCRITFDGTAHFAKGVSLRADNGGKISFGNKFVANQNFFCASNTSISFGDNAVLGWNIHIRDGDGHNIYDENKNIINNNKPISIGNQVWLASYVSILKGVKIPDNSIVAFGSIVTKSFFEKNVIIGGIPASVVKKNINWEI